MPSFHGTIQDSRGNAIGGTVTVTDYYSGAAATLYEADYTTTKSNPVSASTLGKFDFWIPAGAYKLVITSSVGTQTIDRWDALERAYPNPVSSSTTLTQGTAVIEQTASGITTTLWTSPELGDNVEILNSSGGTNYIAGNGNNIHDVATFTLYDDESIKLRWNGTEWRVFA